MSNQTKAKASKLCFAPASSSLNWQESLRRPLKLGDLVIVAPHSSGLFYDSFYIGVVFLREPIVLYPYSSGPNVIEVLSEDTERLWHFPMPLLLRWAFRFASLVAAMKFGRRTPTKC